MNKIVLPRRYATTGVDRHLERGRIVPTLLILQQLLLLLVVVVIVIVVVVVIAIPFGKKTMYRPYADWKTFG